MLEKALTLVHNRSKKGGPYSQEVFITLNVGLTNKNYKLK